MPELNLRPPHLGPYLGRIVNCQRARSPRQESRLSIFKFHIATSQLFHAIRFGGGKMLDESSVSVQVRNFAAREVSGADTTFGWSVLKDTARLATAPPRAMRIGSAEYSRLRSAESRRRIRIPQEN